MDKCVRSHSPEGLVGLNTLLQKAETMSTAALLNKYGTSFMAALDCQATVKKNVNVLQHIMRQLKAALKSADQIELQDMMNRYAKTLVPLVVPLSLVNHYACKYDVPSLKTQIYLKPHPLELMLRNHV